MNKKECFVLGYISKKTGNKGELAFELDTDVPQQYADINTVFIDINDSLVPFFISTITIKGNRAVVLLEGVDSIQKADELIKRSIYLPLSFLPPLKGKRFYFHEMPGFKVKDKTYGYIGVIEQVLDLPQQAVFQIQHGTIEILVPANEQFIISINRELKEIVIDAPEGLIDLYISNSSKTH